MSFGYSVSDAFLLAQLAWNAIQNSRKACGEHDGLTREVSALHVVLRRLEQELKNPESPINVGAAGDTCKQELQVILADCGKVLRVLDKLLKKYNALSEKERSGRKLWQRIRFGNGEMADLGELRGKIILYTSSITFYLNMISMGTVGKIEQEMNKNGGILREIQLAINGITAQFISRNNYEGSVFTSYADDDKSVWREFRRELRQDGFNSSVLHKHKHLILDYIKELGNRGLLDDQGLHEMNEECPGPEPESVTSMDPGSSDATNGKLSEAGFTTTSKEHFEDGQQDVPQMWSPSSTKDAGPFGIKIATEVEESTKGQISSDNQPDIERDAKASDNAINIIRPFSSVSFRSRTDDTYAKSEKQQNQQQMGDDEEEEEEEREGEQSGRLVEAQGEAAPENAQQCRADQNATGPQGNISLIGSDPTPCAGFGDTKGFSATETKCLSDSQRGIPSVFTEKSTTAPKPSRIQRDPDRGAKDKKRVRFSEDFSKRREREGEAKFFARDQRSKPPENRVLLALFLFAGLLASRYS